MPPSHIAANGGEQQSVIHPAPTPPPPAAPPPPPPPPQLHRPHALGSCPACCLGSCLSPAPLTFSPSISQLLHQSGGGGGGADLSYVLMRSLIDETATSGIIHQPALLLKAFKEHQNLFFFFPSACLLLLIFPSINLWA